MLVLNLRFMILVCIYTLIDKKKGMLGMIGSVVFGNLCVDQTNNVM